MSCCLEKPRDDVSIDLRHLFCFIEVDTPPRTYGMSALSVAVSCALSRVAGRPKAAKRCVRAQAGFPNRVVDVVSQLSPEDVSSWESVKSLVTELGLDEDQAEKTMVKAFGWGVQSYWRESKINEVPSFEDVEERLDFLVEIGVPSEKLIDLVTKVPEIIGVPIELLKENVEYVEKNYFMKRSTRNFTNYVLRTPQALGNNVDCAGTCVGECNRCWVR